jgi:hypothetical protein
MQLGLYTFGELTPHWRNGERISARQRLQEIFAAAKLADACGFDAFAVGEHHRIAASPVVLAAIAQVTARLRLASAGTILTTADPVKVFEDFATVDLISGGRAEVIAGRGVFTVRSRYSVMMWRIPIGCSRRISICCCASTPSSASSGRAAFVRLCTMRPSPRARCGRNCRSGSGREGPRTASRGLASSDCHSPISACRRRALRP